MKYLKAFVFSAITLAAQISFAEGNDQASHQVFVGKDFMSLVLNQEQNGKRGFKLQFEKVKKPESESNAQLGGYEVNIQKFNFKTGEQTLLYRFNANKGKEKRAVLVLYSGMLSLLSGTENYYFYVAEEYQKSIRYHAMFNAEPSFEELSKVISAALENPESALVATRWAGKESEVFIYDSGRLKK